jgi:hypothetical protein
MLYLLCKAKFVVICESMQLFYIDLPHAEERRNKILVFTLLEYILTCIDYESIQANNVNSFI